MSETASGLSLLAAAARNTRKRRYLRFNLPALRNVLKKTRASLPYSRFYSLKIIGDGKRVTVAYKRGHIPEENEENEEPVSRSFNGYVVFQPAIRKGKYVTECEFFKVEQIDEEEIATPYTPSFEGIPADPLLTFAMACGKLVTNTIYERTEDSNTEGSYFSRRRKTRRNR
jgi:hypothetical protein